MRLTTVTVSYGQTQSLPEYSNVKPSITLSAEIGEGDDPEAIKQALLGEARAFVQAAIDDALEANERPAKYSTEPRFKVCYTTERYDHSVRGPSRKIEPPDRLVLILPDGAVLANEWHISEPYGATRGIRLSHARRKAAETLSDKPGYTLINASDGDLSKLPAWLTTPPAPKEGPAPATVPAGEFDPYDEPDADDFGGADDDE